MIFSNKNEYEKRILIECDDQCCAITISQWRDDDGVWIGCSESAFSAKQGSKIENYFKRLWKAILGKEYLLFDIALQPRSIQELKDAIAELKVPHESNVSCGEKE